MNAITTAYSPGPQLPQTSPLKQGEMAKTAEKPQDTRKPEGPQVQPIGQSRPLSNLQGQSIGALINTTA